MSNRLVVDAIPGKPALLLGAFDIRSVGYVATEFFVSGNASSYQPDGELSADGRWSVTCSGTAEFTTRIVTLTPTDPAQFNGTVLVEWLNVSGGIDAPAVWMMAHREIVRAGYAYVGVSAQQVGVQGGGVSLLGVDMSLKSQDPSRYAPLRHPGDAFSYDIFSQVGALIRTAHSDSVPGGLGVRHVVAMGESQSAMFMTSYVNAVDPLARAYDGFLVHSRFGGAAPLGDVSIFDEAALGVPSAVTFRTDLRVPLVAIITETDLLSGIRHGYYFARQPDNESLRVWEIPGAAHADNYTIQVAPIDSGSAPLDDIVAAYAPTNMLMGQQLGHYINFAPQHHYVVQAAIAALNNWVRTGEPAPGAPCIRVTETDQPRPVLDANGIARDGVRTPWVDVPTARTSGGAAVQGEAQSIMSALFGSGEPFDAATLQRLYPGGRAEYLDRFTTSLDAAIQSGFILPADRTEILELAAATYAG